MTDADNLHWWKSTRSGNQGQCVEVAVTDDAWHLRDSKNPTQGHLTVSPVAWQAFLGTVIDH